MSSEQIIIKQTLRDFINRSEIEYLFPFKKSNKKSLEYKELKKIFELQKYKVGNIYYNRYAGTFLLST